MWSLRHATSWARVRSLAWWGHSIPIQRTCHPNNTRISRQDTSGKFAGIGVEVDLRNGQVVIISPIVGSPAELAGLAAGDRILMVDGIALDTLPLMEIVHRMRGVKGTTVQLVIRRQGQPAPIAVKVVRDDVKLPSVYARYFDGHVAYVRITSFQEGTHTELLLKMGELKSSWGHVAQ